MARAVFLLALVLSIATAAGGPGWNDTSTHAVLATHLEHTAASPLYDLLANVAAYLPFGEPGFRLALLGALLGAIAVAGVLRAATELMPKDPAVGVIAAALLFVAPPFRDASGASLLAASGAVWALAFAVRREATARDALAALACAGVAIGAAPWLGAPLLVAIGIAVSRTAPRSLLALAVGAIGALAVLLWIGAIGRMADPHVAFGAFITSSAPAAVLVGIGLLGTAFAAVTRLPNARWLVALVAIAVAHAVFVDPDPTVVLALLAVGAAVIPGAIVRMLPERRHVVAAAAGVPLLGIALLTGGRITVDDPRDAPARLATDLTSDIPPGPGVFIATRLTTWAAIEYAQLVAGDRPDLVLAPPLPGERADILVANALRSNRVAGSDVFAFGRLFPRRAFPRNRGFELLGTEPTALAPIPPPARYASTTGELESIELALALARYEGGFGRLDAAAFAAGVDARFNAADRAILKTAQPVHPPLFGALPDFGTPPGHWLLDVFGDDIAWVAGIDQPDPPSDAPPARRLHALWRKLLTGAIKADDPAITALGPIATKATAALVAPTK